MPKLLPRPYGRGSVKMAAALSEPRGWPRGGGV